ncbi:preprotein translocase subunit YajC [Halomonas sp. McH1-25]|uniref:preprotein translocase subunit YajC n=1 Tax=unclassified Halomonas TaxID=2609666 RepID=UPI001EF51A3E|nr:MULTISPECIES: preprotein translocase subunit YajC [unclassified Halomonas]MCG7602031.1 preprotein translocase subunit YajC [Halomonas sp. McH1-25]MCP1344430.1 preprotein translocase subunit YajC [Halomonas sp. FL8]MCP1362276.1 preprotein translocase subunit YajC [Halomonas sp. BBD45]
MTFWLVTVLAMLAVLSPVLVLRPSRRDQRLGGLRQHARQAGIGVKIAKPPLHDPPGGLVSYCWRYPQAHPGPLFLLVRDAYASAALKPFDTEWRWRIEPLKPLSQDSAAALARLLASLPEDALIVESERGALTLWWGESLSLEAFETCDKAMGEVRDRLASPHVEKGLSGRLP